MSKVSKESVNYRHATGAHRCGNCIMFNRHNSSCSLVDGPIRATDTCDRWAPEARKMDGDPRMVPLRLSQLRTEYFDTLNELLLYKRANVAPGMQTELQARAWAAKREAFPLLAQLMDEGVDIRQAAAGFSWTEKQLGNQALRKWLCMPQETSVDSSEA